MTKERTNEILTDAKPCPFADPRSSTFPVNPMVTLVYTVEVA